MSKSTINLKRRNLLVILFNLFKNNFPFIFILVSAIFLRVFRLSELTTFGGDQGQDFLVVKDMVLYQKWTLLGIKTSGYSFFQGPVYLYMIYPFFLLLKLNPISGAVAAIFYSMISLIILYILGIKFFTKRIAIISSLLYTVSGEFIIFGNTPLYQHFLPLLIIISLYFFLIKKKNILIYILLGLSVGIGIELHLLNISLVLAIFIYLLIYEKRKIDKIFSYIFGIILGVSPTIAFELRHNLLNTRYLLNYHPQNETEFQLVQIFNQWFEGFNVYFGGRNILIGIFLLLIYIVFLIRKSKTEYSLKLKRLSLILIVVSIILSIIFSAFGHHYLIPFWTLLLIIIPVIIESIFNTKIANIIVVILVASNLFFSLDKLNDNHGYSMPDGWSLKKIVYTSKIIAKDSPEHPNFNVAALLDPVSRAYPLRYATEVYGQKPEPVENYPSNNYLYVVSRYNRNKMSEITTWEVTSFYPFKIGETWDLKDGIYLYRLDRIRSL